MKDIKPNTTRFMLISDAEELQNWFKSSKCPCIKIKAEDHSGQFLRVITDVTVADIATLYPELCMFFPAAMRMVIVSWEKYETKE